MFMVVDNMITTPLEYTSNGFTATNKSGESVSFCVQGCSIYHSLTVINAVNEAFVILIFTDKLTPDNVIILKTDGIEPFVNTVDLVNIPQFVKKFHVEFARTDNNG